jgi:uroporphyrinogen III methyltransferase/synthase
MNRKGKVYLIGAGPGDPGLLTIKGKDCLTKADVVIYDYLVNPKLLRHAKPEAERIYVGKRRGHKELPQDEINRLLVDKAREGNIVARLKGGDPFIFGRGGEEAEELARHGIPFEIIPGVTSVSAVPAYAGIPITHRDFTSSFVVATGHEDPKKEKSRLSWENLAKTETVVFLMGVKNIEENMRKLVEFGKPRETPVAIISWGTHPAQRTVTGTIGDVVELVKANPVKAPAVIVVGEVVRLRDVINWFETKPLFGKKVLVTRARKQSGPLVELLEAEGAEVIEFPTIEVFPPDSWDELDGAIRNLNNYHWVIFTSVNGVHFFFERFRSLKKDIRELKGIKFAAIGEPTAKEIAGLGLAIDMIPADFKAEGLLENFRKGDIRGKKILIPRAKEAREILPEELHRLGADVSVVTAYQTKKPLIDNVAEVRQMLKRGRIDLVTFTSSSTAKNFFSLLGRDEKVLSNLVTACIGPITADTVRKFGKEPEIICKKYTVEDLVKEVVHYFENIE